MYLGVVSRKKESSGPNAAHVFDKPDVHVVYNV